MALTHQTRPSRVRTVAAQWGPISDLGGYTVSSGFILGHKHMQVRIGSAYYSVQTNPTCSINGGSDCVASVDNFASGNVRLHLSSNPIVPAYPGHLPYYEDYAFAPIDIAAPIGWGKNISGVSAPTALSYTNPWENPSVPTAKPTVFKAKVFASTSSFYMNSNDGFGPYPDHGLFLWMDSPCDITPEAKQNPQSFFSWDGSGVSFSGATIRRVADLPLFRIIATSGGGTSVSRKLNIAAGAFVRGGVLNDSASSIDLIVNVSVAIDTYLHGQIRAYDSTDDEPLSSSDDCHPYADDSSTGRIRYSDPSITSGIRYNKCETTSGSTEAFAETRSHLNYLTAWPLDGGISKITIGSDSEWSVTDENGDESTETVYPILNDGAVVGSVMTDVWGADLINDNYNKTKDHFGLGRLNSAFSQNLYLNDDGATVPTTLDYQIYDEFGYRILDKSVSVFSGAVITDQVLDNRGTLTDLDIGDEIYILGSSASRASVRNKVGSYSVNDNSATLSINRAFVYSLDTDYWQDIYDVDQYWFQKLGSIDDRGVSGGNASFLVTVVARFKPDDPTTTDYADPDIYPISFVNIYPIPLDDFTTASLGDEYMNPNVEPPTYTPGATWGTPVVSTPPVVSIDIEVVNEFGVPFWDAETEYDFSEEVIYTEEYYDGGCFITRQRRYTSIVDNNIGNIPETGDYWEESAYDIIVTATNSESVEGDTSSTGINAYEVEMSMPSHAGVGHWSDVGGVDIYISGTQNRPSHRTATGLTDAGANYVVHGYIDSDQTGIIAGL